MNLVIVESPSKAKTIEKYLGKNYKVIASKGHIADLPKSTLAIDVEKSYKPSYEVKNPAVLKTIKNEFKNAKSLILAVDPDREGEAIGWHIARELKLINDKGESIKGKGKELSRIVFTEITKEAVLKAINNPRNIDINLVNAQQTRRILDRLVGYKLSPLLWKKLMFGLSAGRVQSVALKLIVEKEEEREKFKSKEYWNLNTYLNIEKSKSPVRIIINKTDNSEELLENQDNSKLKFSLVKNKEAKIIIANEQEVKKINNDIISSDWIVSDIQKKQISRSPYPPFNTSTLQQSSASVLGFSASRTMKIAQQLYEKGYITYMRTDSLNISTKALDELKKYILKKYGNKYLPIKPRFYKTKSKVAQEAHEAIRVTNIEKSASDYKLTLDQKKLYELIRNRALASQMSDSIIESNKIVIKIKDYTFEMDGQKVIFPGHYIVRNDKLKDVDLPNLYIGQKLYLSIIEAQQKFTEPPARFSEASLIKTLEANGIGRPSTYAPIISTLLLRKYVEKEGKFLKPTLVGISLINLLKDHFKEIIDVNFTAEMEDNLDKIANGELIWKKVLDNFYIGFEKDIKKGEKNIDRDKYKIIGKSDEKCPECGGKMIIKLGRFSPFLSCDKFPKCKGILSLKKNSESNNIDIESDDFKKCYVSAPLTDDGRNYLLKEGRFGHFWAHPDYPKVKDAKQLEYLPEVKRKIFGNPPSDNGVKLVLKKGRFGYFWAHTDYPKIKIIKKINNKEAKQKIKDLGLLII